MDRKPKFVTSLSKKSVKKKKETSKPRTTKRSWMRDECYLYSRNCDDRVLTFNVMEVAERMCKSNKWDKAVANANKSTIGKHRSLSSNRTMKHLWANTMKYKGALPGVKVAKSRWHHDSLPIGNIRITKGKSAGGGHGGLGYGVTMRCGERSLSYTLAVLLHELVHVVQGKLSRVNGKSRPHDLRFNLILTSMAKSFFGYNFHPYEVGFSVGRGYAPQCHLEHWLNDQLEDNNPKVLKWFTIGEIECP